jgi:hypothetical protein
VPRAPLPVRDGDPCFGILLIAVSSTGRSVLLCAAAIVAGAFLLRAYRIGVEELWLDEAFSFGDVTAAGWPGGIRLRFVPPLYPLCLRGWMAVAGDSEAGLRLLSALCGTLFVAGTMWAGGELFDRRVALWGGLWAALSPIGIYYSQEARAYALLTALLLLTHVLVWRAIRTNTWGRWALVSVAAAAALYTHYLAVFALVPTGFALGLSSAPGRWRRWGAALAISGLVFLPWVVWDFVLAPHPLGGIDWIREAWERTPPRLAIPKSLEVLYLGSQKGFVPITLKQFDALEYPGALRLLGLTGLGVLGLWLAGPWGNANLAVPRSGRRAGLLWLLLLCPLVTLWTISFVRPVYLVGRYDQLAFPAFPLLLGFGFGKLQAVRRSGPPLAAVAAGVLLVPVAVKLLLFYRQPPYNREKARVTAEFVTQKVENGQLVLFTDLRGYPVVYQLHRLGYRSENGWYENPASGRRFLCRMFPRELGPAPAGGDAERIANAPDVVWGDLQEDLAAIGPSVQAAYVVLGSYVVSGAAFSVPREDGLLLEQLGQLGFSLVAFDPGLGVGEYRRTPPHLSP